MMFPFRFEIILMFFSTISWKISTQYYDKVTAPQATTVAAPKSLPGDCSDVINQVDIRREDCNPQHCFTPNELFPEVGICYNQKINGGWTPWSQWSGLIGARSEANRTRECRQPPPIYGGDDCSGPSLETRSKSNRISEYPKKSGWSFYHEVIDSRYLTQYSSQILAKKVSKLQCVLKCVHNEECQVATFVLGKYKDDGSGECYALVKTSSAKSETDFSVVLNNGDVSFFEEQPL